MNTLSRPNRSIYKSGNALGANTQNVAFNLNDQGVTILDDIAKPNRSQFIREAIALKIFLVDPLAALAFRVAAGVKATFKSIFCPAPPDQQAEAFKEAIKIELAEKQSAKGNADKIVEDAVGEFSDEANFIPKGQTK